jgi:hypothetical protein
LQPQSKSEVSVGKSSQVGAQRPSSTLDKHSLSLADLPLQFEENVGQADARARFLARGGGYTLLLNGDGLALNLSGPRGAKAQGMNMHLLGAQPGEISGREQTATRTNYYIGADPSKWHQGVHSFLSVAYRGVYPGIDLIYHGNGSQLEYDFVVSPGANPEQIRMGFDGLTPRLDGEDISFGKENQVSIRALKAIQRIGGETKLVDASWKVEGDQASVHVGSYDHSQPLIIDPVFFYGSYIGGTGNDIPVSIVPASQQGFYFIALSTNSAVIQEPGTTSANNGNCDLQDCPVNPDCNPQGCPVDTLVLGINTTPIPVPATPFPPYTNAGPPSPKLIIGSATYIGGTSGSTAPTAMAGDSSGNLYVTGTTNQGGSFPSLASQPCSIACIGFIAKLATSLDSAAGSATLTLKYEFGLPVNPAAVATDSTGDTYLTGSASTAPNGLKLTVPATDTTFQKLTALGTSLTSGTHAFLLELSPSGAPLFASYIGGSGADQGNSVAVSGQSVFVAGQTSSSDFPSTVGNVFGGGQDAFVLAAQNLATTPKLTYSTYLGGEGTDTAASIAAGLKETVVVAGTSNSANFPTQPEPNFSAQNWPLVANSDGFSGTYYTAPTTTPTAVDLPVAIPEGNQDAYVTSLAADGSLTFTDFLGGNPGANTSTVAKAVALDSVGVVYVTGSSTLGSGGFLNGAVTSDLRPHEDPGQSYVFFAQIDPSGKSLLQATIAGSSGTDTGTSLTVSSPQESPGVASIVGSTVLESQNGNVPNLFESASSSLLNPIDPFAPTKDSSSDATGFFVEEALAGYCNMSLAKQVGPKLSFSGSCIGGTQSGTLFANATGSNGTVTPLTPVPITIAASQGVPTGTATLDLGALTGSQKLNVSFGFLPVGAIGGAGTCSFSNEGPNGATGVSGCSITVTGGGGGGTIFSVTSGVLSVSVSCTTNCNYLGQMNTVQAGKVANLSAMIENGSPGVSWTPVNSSSGQLINPTTTAASFVAGVSGGITKITATANADNTTTENPLLELTTLEIPVINASLSTSGNPVYGQSVSINVSATGNYTTPSGSFTYQVDNGTAAAGTLSASGIATILLNGLSATTHTITISYPGNYLNKGYFAPGTGSLSFTVNEAPLTVTATNASVPYLKPIPTLAYTISGFKYNDNQSTIGGVPTETTKATETSLPGSYAITITQGTLGELTQSASNYTYSFVNGTVTIESPGAAAAPVITPAAGTYTSTPTITISDATTGAKIYYTLDGSAPSASSTPYTAPFPLHSSSTVQAIAIATGYGNSGLGSAVYTLDPPTLSSSSLAFGSIVQGLTSTPQTVSFTNKGLNQLTNLAFAITGANAGDFAVNSSTTCSSTLAAGATCTITVVFAPTAVGSRNAAISVSYGGIGSPLSATLQGTGVAPLTITSTVTELTAGSTYQFTANQPVSWSASAGNIDSTGSFTAPNPPPSPAVVTITAISIDNSHVSATTQVTIAPAPTVTVPSSNNLTAGQSLSIPFSLGTGTGISGDSYKLACAPASLPSDVTCVFNPNPIVNSPGSNSGTLVVTSNALNSRLLNQKRPGSNLPLGGSTLALACCFLFGIRRRVNGRVWMLALALVASGTILSMTACGTGGSFKTGSGSDYATGTFAIKSTVTGANPSSSDYNQTVSTFTVNVTIQ